MRISIKMLTGLFLGGIALCIHSPIELPKHYQIETVVVQDVVQNGTRPVQEIQVLKSVMPDLDEEEKLGNMEMLSILVQAEAGNQDLEGMQLVADVVLNRIDSGKFPNNMEDVIYQDRQFGPVMTGAYEDAAWHMSQNAYLAVELEWDRETRLDNQILYFNTKPDSGKNHFKHGGHYFGY